MAVCRVEEFEPKRLLRNAERCREKLMPYSTREAYLVMLEEIYNFRQQKLVALKVLAEMTRRETKGVEPKKQTNSNGQRRQNGR